MIKINQHYLIFKTIMETIALDGWQVLNFHALTDDIDFDVLQLKNSLKNKSDILIAFAEFIDAQMLNVADDELKDPQILVRERLLEALMIRIDLLTPYKAGIIELLRNTPKNPSMIIEGAKALQYSMELTFNMVGLSTKGLQGILRVKGLSAVFLAGLYAWSRDDSEDLSFTLSILDKHLRQAENFIVSVGLMDA
jgi:hypothetical protein